MEPPKTNETFRIPKPFSRGRRARPVALLTAILFSAATLPMTVAASEVGTGLPAGCEDALRGVHATLLAEDATRSPSEALALLQKEAGAPCGFDLFAGTSTTDPEAFAAFVADLNGDVEPPRNVMMLEDFIQGAPVPCAVPGSGIGGISLTVLGVEIWNGPADGVWQPTPAGVKVTGDGGVVGGSQTGAVGTILIAGVPIPVAAEMSQALCNEIQVVTSIHESCWLIWVGATCETIVGLTPQLKACGAWAKQSLLGLVRTSHRYSTIVDGC